MSEARVDGMLPLVPTGGVRAHISSPKVHIRHQSATAVYAPFVHQALYAVTGSSLTAAVRGCKVIGLAAPAGQQDSQRAGAVGGFGV